MIYFTVERLVSEMMVQISMAGLIGSNVCNHVSEAGIFMKLIVLYSFLISFHFKPVLQSRVFSVQLFEQDCISVNSLLLEVADPAMACGW